MSLRWKARLATGWLILCSLAVVWAVPLDRVVAWYVGLGAGFLAATALSIARDIERENTEREP